MNDDVKIPIASPLLKSLDDLKLPLKMFYGDKCITREDLQAFSKVIAGGLAGAGVAKGENVILYLSNSEHYVAALHGVWRINAVVVSLYLTTSPGEFEKICEQTQARFVIVDERNRSLPLLQGKGLKILTLEGLLKGEVNCEQDSVFSHEYDNAAIIYTSGSSGNPKGVIHTHYSLYHAAKNYRETLEQSAHFEVLLSEVTHLNLFPLQSNVALLKILLVIQAGGTLVLAKNNVQIVEVLEVIERFQVTAIQLGPQLLRDFLLHEREIEWEKLSSVKVWFTAGAPFNVHERVRFEGCFPGKVYLRYGLTEIAGGVFMQTPLKRGGVGQLMANCQAEIVLDKNLGHASGELRIKTAALAAGYLGVKEEWDGLVREGWLYTGDVGCFDSDHCMQIIGRKKNVIIPGTFTVWASEVEAILRRKSEIHQCAVFGMKDDLLGEIVVAAVQLHPQKSIHWSEIREHCLQFLLPQKSPQLIWIVPEIPLTHRGKVDLPRLRADLESLLLESAAMDSDGSTSAGEGSNQVFEAMSVMDYFIRDGFEKLQQKFDHLGLSQLVAAEICGRLSIIFKRRILTSQIYQAKNLEHFMREYCQLGQGISLGLSRGTDLANSQKNAVG